MFFALSFISFSQTNLTSSIYDFPVQRKSKIAIIKKDSINKNTPSSEINLKKKGFLLATELSYGKGMTKDVISYFSTINAGNTFSFKPIIGYQICEYLAFGIAPGIENYRNLAVFPTTLEIRTTMLKGKTSPILNTSIGYTFNNNNITVNEGPFYGNEDIVIKLKGGIVANITIGIKRYISKNTAYFFTFGYKTQTQEEIYTGKYGNHSTLMLNSKFLTVNTGFTF